LFTLQVEEVIESGQIIKKITARIESTVIVVVMMKSKESAENVDSVDESLI